MTKLKKQCIGVVDYIRELPRSMTVKQWKKMHKISNNLIYGKEEYIGNYKGNNGSPKR